MNRAISIAFTLAAAASIGIAKLAQAQSGPAPAAAPAAFKRNWTPPAYKMKAQVLVDAIMAEHPELLGLTFHAVPPVMTEFTMFAASYHDRIGKVSGADDAMATTMGRIMFETRYKAGEHKAVVLIPLQDNAGNEIATAVFGFHDNVGNVKTAAYYISAAIQMRDALARQIAGHDDLFAKAE